MVGEVRVMGCQNNTLDYYIGLRWRHGVITFDESEVLKGAIKGETLVRSQEVGRTAELIVNTASKCPAWYWLTRGTDG
jgi:hypothetical protein